MIEVQKGPAAFIPEPHEQFDVNFRMLTAHQVATDCEITRLDVLVSNRQMWNVSFNCSKESALLVPKSGVTGGWAVKCSRRDLAQALRGLADAIEVKE